MEIATLIAVITEAIFTVVAVFVSIRLVNLNYK